MNVSDKRSIIKIIEDLQIKIDFIFKIREERKDKLKNMPPRTKILGYKGENLEREIMCLETAGSELFDAMTDLCKAIE